MKKTNIDKNINNNLSEEKNNTSYDFVNVKDTKENEKINREGKNSFVLVCLLFAILSALIFTPAFNVKNIIVSGNNVLTTEQVIKASGIKSSHNILQTDTNSAKKKILKLPIVNDVTITRKFPSTIDIKLNECVKLAYINYMGKYICIDKNGKILEILKQTTDENLIIISGITPKEFLVGNTIVLKETDKLAIVKQVLDEVHKSDDLPNAIKQLNFKDQKSITMTLDNEIIVNIGDASNLSYKFAYLKETLRTQLKTYRGGTLDLSDPQSSVRYKGSGE